MNFTEHKMFDKRQRKPRIVNDIAQGLDYVMVKEYSLKYGKSKIEFWPPNLSGVFYKIAEENFKKASKIHREFIKPKESENKIFELSNEETIFLYDFIEAMQISIIMICTAIESVTNSMIPSSFSYKEKNNKGEKVLDYFDIQQKLSLTDKLSKVLYQAHNIQLSKNKNWPNFKKLISLRNDLIHLKSKNTSSVYDQRPHFNDLDKDIVYSLVQDNALCYLKSGFNTIYEMRIHYKNNRDFPIIYDKEDLSVERVDNIRNHFKPR